VRPLVVVSERGFSPNHVRAKAAAVAGVGLWAVSGSVCRRPASKQVGAERPGKGGQRG